MWEGQFSFSLSLDKVKSERDVPMLSNTDKPLSSSIKHELMEFLF